MIKSPAWNKARGWTLVLGLVLILLADPAGVDEHQRKETVRKSNSRKVNRPNLQVTRECTQFINCRDKHLDQGFTVRKENVQTKLKE